MADPVQQLKEEYDALVEYLTSQQPSLVNDLNKNFRKVLLLSAGSYFESQITSILISFVKAKSNEDQRIISFLEKQAISQKYHTLFSWGKKDTPDQPEKSAAAFFRLFGDSFKRDVENELKPQKDDDENAIGRRAEIKISIEAFLEIGHLRNILVHSNFAAYNYDQKTTQEIYDLYLKAKPFLEYITQKLN
ncbi:MAG: hypothetical protein HYZ14_03140 [Bacteroidetes bacterium]|nr:hypothetical protein [Bacteroidota bacterium]